MAADTVLAGVAIALGLILHLGPGFVADHPGALTALVGSSMVATAAMGRLFALDRRSWRFASLTELVLVITVVSAAVLVVALGMRLLGPADLVPPSVYVVVWLTTIVALGGMRLLYREACRTLARKATVDASRRRVPVLLHGTDQQAQWFVRATQTDPASTYRVVGLIADRADMVGRVVDGVAVLGTVESLGALVVELTARGEAPRHVVLTECGAASRWRVVEAARAAGVPVGRLRSLADVTTRLDDGGDEVGPVMLESLLGRPPHSLDHAGTAAMIAGGRVLITGAGGSIGTELVRQVARLAPASLVLVDHAEYNLYRISLEVGESWPQLACVAQIADVRDRDRVDSLFAHHQPEIVFHAAALKHVPIVEANAAEGVLTNVSGTVNVADACRKHGVAVMVLISTDKAVRPAAMLGATKRLAEYYCQSLDRMAVEPGTTRTRLVAVRFGNILGSSGSVVPLFRRQILAGGPVTVTDPMMTRYFMTAEEAVALVLRATVLASSGGCAPGDVLILDMGEPVTIVDLARRLIEIWQPADGDIQIEFTGLRSGEKLHEDLFDQSELRVETEVEGVLAARPRQPATMVAALIDDLIAAAQSTDGPEIAARVWATLAAIQAERSAPSGDPAAPARHDGSRHDDGGRTAGQDQPAPHWCA